MTRVQLFFANPRRSAQLLVWALVAATVIPLVSILTSSADTFYLSAPPPTETTVVPAGEVIAADELVLASYAPGVSNPAKVTDDTNWLPAWRWQGQLQYPEQLSFWDFASKPANAILGLGIQLASGVWSIMTNFVKFAISSDILSGLAGQINVMYAKMWGALSQSGVIMVIALLGLFLALGAVLRGRIATGVKAVLGGVIVISLMQFMGVAAMNATDGASDKHLTALSSKATSADKQAAAAADAYARQAAAKGTPAWLAQMVLKQTDSLSNTFGSLFGAANGLASAGTGGLQWELESDGNASCSAYTRSLYATYDKDKRITDSASVKNSMSMMSYVWERAVYDNWVWGAFGGTPNGARMGCHYLETKAGVTAEVQQAVALGAGGAYAGIAQGPFRAPSYDTKEYQSSLFAWAACASDGRMRDGWRHITEKFDEPSKGNGNKACSKWWNDAEGGNGAHDLFGFDWSAPHHVFRDTIGDKNNWGRPENVSDPKTFNALTDVLVTTETFWGNDLGMRAFTTAVALITSVMYAFLLLGAAAGALMSQIAVAVLMFILPVTLLLIAVPQKDGSRNPIGMRLVRLTLTSFAGKLVFLTLLGLTISIIGLLFAAGSFVFDWTSGQPALVKYGAYAAWSILVPLSAIWLIKKITKLFGMQNVTGLKGAAQFATAAISQGQDGKWLSSKTSGTRERPGKIRSSLTAAGDMALSKGKDLAFGELASRRNSKILSRTNADGTSFLDEDLRARLVAGKTNSWVARREQTARNHQLSPHLAARVARGELTLSQALRMSEAARNAMVAGTKSTFLPPDFSAQQDATDPFNSYGPAGSTEPGQQTGRDEAQNTKKLRRRAMHAEQAAERDPGRREKIGVDQLGTEMDEVTARLRTDGKSGPLSVSEAHLAQEGYASKLPDSLKGSVLMGGTGMPPLLKPMVSADGFLEISDEALKDREVLKEILANPLNLLPPEFVQRLDRESTHEYHARLSAALVDTGLIDDRGRVVDVLGEFGIDDITSTADFDKAVSLATQWRDNGAFNTQEIQTKLTGLNADSLARINGVTTELVQHYEVQMQVDDLTLGEADRLREQAQNVVQKVEVRTENVEKRLEELVAAVGNSRAFGRAEATVVQELTATLPKEINAALAAKWEAAFKAAEISGGISEELRAQAQKEFDEISKQMSQVIADVRLSQGSGTTTAAQAAAAKLTETYKRLAQEQHEKAEDFWWEGAARTEAAEGEKRRAMDW